MYHGAERRGTKSISLLSSSLPPPSFEHEDFKVFDFRTRNVSFCYNTVSVVMMVKLVMMIIIIITRRRRKRRCRRRRRKKRRKKTNIKITILIFITIIISSCDNNKNDIKTLLRLKYSTTRWQLPLHSLINILFYLAL